MIDVVSFGLGPIGMGIATNLLDREDIVIVGGIDSSPQIAGKDLGTLLSRAPMGIEITSEPARALNNRRGGVVIHATSSRLASIVDQLETITDSGWNVLSTCEELVCPSAADPALALSIDGMAIRAGVTVIGAGVNPGFLMDSLPLALSALCLRVDSVKVRRIVDTNQRRPQLQAKVGVGLTRVQFDQRVATGGIGHVGLKQSAYLIADRLGWAVTEYEENLEAVIAAEETGTPMGSVSAGNVLGQRQVANLHSGDRERVVLELEMFAGARTEDRILIDGDPSIIQTIPGGINGDAATVALLSNLVRPVREARPGLLTMADILALSCGAGLRG